MHSLHSLCHGRLTTIPYPFFNALPLLPLLLAHLALSHPSYLIARVVHQSSPKPLRRTVRHSCSTAPSTPSLSLVRHSSSTSMSSTFHGAQSLPSHAPSLSSNATSTISRPATNTYSFEAAPRSDSASTESKGPFASELITLHEPFGQYFAVMELGSPRSEITLIIDTGSEITWVQCQPCLKCGSQIRDPVFDPSRSHTYHKLHCNSKWCHDTSGLSIGCPKPSSFSSAAANMNDSSSPVVHPIECIYNATYGDNSVSYGELSIDTLTIASASGHPVAVPKFVFGCGRVNTGVETDFNASGLMGLDKGSHSIISQLGMKNFAYCLPDRSQSIDAAGFVVFGNFDPMLMHRKWHEQVHPSGPEDVDDETRLPPMQYAKLLPNDKSDFYAQSYYINLTGIRVGKQLLDIPSSLFDIDPNTGDGGTIVDTGTSLTSFLDLTYSVFQEAVRTNVSGGARPIYIEELPSFDTCYTVGRGEGWPHAPDIYLQFDGGATEVKLPESNVWLQVGTEGDRNLYCLAFAAAGDGTGGRNVIGNFQQQNFMVHYDMTEARIGFVHLRRCSSGTEGTQRQQKTGISSGLWLLCVYSLIIFLSWS